MLPPTCTVRPVPAKLSRSISPTSVVVVVLPLLPVMAITGHGAICKVSRLSLLNRMPRSMAVLHDGQLGRYAAAQAEQITAVQQGEGVTAQGQGDRQVPQRPQFLGQLFRCRGVTHGDLSARLHKKARQGQPLTGQPQNQDRFAGKFTRCHGLCLFYPLRFRYAATE